MSELETLFVRIEADLSDFKRGLREAGRETRTFTTGANRDFTTLLERTSQEAGTLNDVVGVLGRGFIDAFEGAIQRGESFSDVLKGLALDMARLAAQRGADALFGGLLGGLFGGGGGFAESLIPFARGGAFASGIGELIAATQGTAAVQRFARGGVLESPTLFRFARGVGLAGEAGPEAILPLARMGDGKLGVLAGPPPLSQAGPPPLPDPGGAGITVVNYEFTINAPGADREGLREVMALIQVVRREGMDTRRMIRPVALSAVLDSRRRGGSIARAFGAR